ncbi:AraC family transcriptional regulator [Agrobacterium deltaense Zutra 3/1]|uniref:AraC family transcriptional regulator n=1 Tax=Agrobacterium deltaense Zutra 3/1 TaxID=1183427 RepID=A0A1S7RQQ4_9HYPH|nr:helix-turn-helix transcriptional regulator [Agrobacterium deltaense]CUX56014.1 AraC family transcriptional regulator [Agrobacterium deltaense Zutra 3/1]
MAKINSMMFGSFSAEDHNYMLKLIDGTNEPVLAICRTYATGHRAPVHSHLRAQIWHARRGVVLVSTADGRWMIPPGHGLIIPAGLEHESETISTVEMQSIYVHPDLFHAEVPRVVEITDLASSLIAELLGEEHEPPAFHRRGLVRALLLDEINRLPERPLGLPFPDNERLAALCRDFLKKPVARVEIDDWAAAMGISRRSFTRLFRNELGVSFVTWRQQACIFASLPRLAAGEAVTNVALDAGYENIPAFTTMFRRMLGSSPRAYRQAARQRSAAFSDTEDIGD